MVFCIVDKGENMSGHSKFANIKHKKEKNDAAKGKIFTVIGREIAVAVKEGGPDPNNNSKLRDVIAKAKANNVPNDTIERGIKKAAGDINSVNYEQNTYEGYGPNGVTTVNGAKSTTYAILSNDNPDLKWEVKQTFDVGVDFSAFKNRLNVTLDWYTSTTKDLLYLYTVPVPPFTYNTLLANMGKMTNMGFEIGVRGDIVRSKDFTFNSGLNLSFQKNKLNSLSGYYKGQLLTTSEHIAVANINAAGLTQNTGVSYLIEGQPIGVFYLPHCEGINANGQYVISDLDHNKTIDTGDSGDRKVCGQAIPKAYLGWDFTFKYKNWDLTMQFNGAFGHKIYNGTGMTYSNMNNFPTYNVLAEAPQKGIKDIQISDYWLEKGDYVNFEYVTLGYTFGKKQLKANWIQSLHLGLSVNNVYMFTGYKGLSPLINSTSLVRVDEGRTTYGTIGVDDKRLYPLSRTFSFNVSVTF